MGRRKVAGHDAPEMEVVSQDDADLYVEADERLNAEVSDDEVLSSVEDYQPAESEVIKESVDDEQGAEDWRHKYEVLKGKYDSEVPRLYKEIKALKRERDNLLSRMNLLEQIVMQMQSVQAQGGSSAPQQAKEQVEEDEELKRLKEDYPEIYKAVAKLVEKKVGPVENKVTEFNKEVAIQTFYAKLDSMLPEWRQLNSDPDFLEWLSQPEGDTGFTRHQLMLMAYNNLDAAGVAKWFKKFLNNDSAPVQKEVSRAEKNVVPYGKKTSYASKESSKRLFKESEIQRFYTDLALGRIPQDRAREMEKEIMSALMEDRIIYGK